MSRIRRRLGPLGSLPRRGAVLLVRLYQASLSSILGRQCRFTPTCSSYFAEALEAHGLLRGGLAGIWRLLRCNPFSAGGYDPVDQPLPRRQRY